MRSPARNAEARTTQLIKGVRLVVVEGGPHAVPWTHADQVNTALPDIIRS